MPWRLLPEGRTFRDRPNGTFEIRDADRCVYVQVSAFLPFGTQRENRQLARLTAKRIVELLTSSDDAQAARKDEES